MKDQPTLKGHAPSGAMTSRRGEVGFTLIELLIVLLILASLAVLVALAINPAEAIKRTRDAKRIQELSNLRSSIEIALSSTQKPAEELFLGAYGSSTDEGAQSTDGTGWVKIDLSRNLPALPIDQVQTGDPSYRFEFKQSGGKYEIRVRLESAEKREQTGEIDGGDDPEHFELGNNLTLL